MSKAVWYRGICDEALAKVELWLRAWPMGDVAATRPLMDKGRIVDVPTKRAVKMSWRTGELEHIVRILQTVKPNWELTGYMEEVLAHHKSGRKVAGSFGLEFVCIMMTYIQDVEEIRNVLVDVRDNKENPSEGLKPGDSLWNF